MAKKKKAHKIEKDVPSMPRSLPTKPSKKVSPQTPSQTPPLAPPQIVVGIGASAGGVEALKNFFSTQPKTDQMAFVVIQHLDPDHESLMASLLSSCSTMPVEQISRRVPIKSGHVYVCPPNKYVTISNGFLGLTKPTEKRGTQEAINFFLRV